jgi:purine-binding chemotaxis protein CheW
MLEIHKLQEACNDRRIGAGARGNRLHKPRTSDSHGRRSNLRHPLAPPSIAGSLNLRGRIVTAINMRACLDMADRAPGAKTMSVVVENKGELYSLMIDSVGDVMNLPYSDYEKNPATLNPQWRALCQGIYRLKDKLLVVLDVPRLLEGLQPHEEE